MKRRQYKTIYKVMKSCPGMIGGFIYGIAETEELAKDEIKRLRKTNIRKWHGTYHGDFYMVKQRMRIK